jgi:hypothetical protein
MMPSPTLPGSYAAEVYFGWKLLDWRDGQWWHPNLNSPWTATAPVQWVGPLPARKQVEKPKMEFDL